MIKQIISNELENRCKRPVNETEVILALEYIQEWLSNTTNPTFADVVEAMDGFINDNYAACDVCGELHLSDELTDEFGVRICNNSVCYKQAKEEYEFDPHLEWGTDSRHCF